MKKILIMIIALVSLVSCASGTSQQNGSGSDQISMTKEERLISESLDIEAVQVDLFSNKFTGFIAVKNTSYESIYEYVEFRAQVSFKDHYGVIMFASQPICDESSPFLARQTRPFFIATSLTAMVTATIKDNEWDWGYRLLVSFRVNGGEWIPFGEYDFPAAEKDGLGRSSSSINIDNRYSYTY